MGLLVDSWQCLHRSESGSDVSSSVIIGPFTCVTARSLESLEGLSDPILVTVLRSMYIALSADRPTKQCFVDHYLLELLADTATIITAVVVRFSKPHYDHRSRVMMIIVISNKLHYGHPKPKRTKTKTEAPYPYDGGRKDFQERQKRARATHSAII